MYYIFNIYGNDKCLCLNKLSEFIHYYLCRVEEPHHFFEESDYLRIETKTDFSFSRKRKYSKNEHIFAKFRFAKIFRFHEIICYICSRFCVNVFYKQINAYI
jgi:hypothetical protein